MSNPSSANCSLGDAKFGMPTSCAAYPTFPTLDDLPTATSGEKQISIPCSSLADKALGISPSMPSPMLILFPCCECSSSSLNENVWSLVAGEKMGVASDSAFDESEMEVSDEECACRFFNPLAGEAPGGG